MNKPPMSKTAWEKSAQTHFRKAEQSETSLKQTRRKERAADAAKTEKLRALRLAKEAQDKLAAETETPTNGSVKPAARPKQSKRGRSEDLLKRLQIGAEVTRSLATLFEMLLNWLARSEDGNSEEMASLLVKRR